MNVMSRPIHLLHSIWTHPANRQHRLRSIWRALAWQVHKRLTGTPVDVGIRELRLRCYPDSHSASRAIYFSGLPDYWEMRFMIDYLRPGDRFIDVGANVGLYTLLAGSIVGSAGHIDAFEPGALAADRLRESVEVNAMTNVSLHPVAVSDVAGKANFILTDDDCCAHISPAALDGVCSRPVPTVRLDTHLLNQFYAMAKMDIEGFEPFAVRGASSLMKQRQLPVILLEVAGYSKRFGISTSDFIIELKGLGYECASYNPMTRELRPTQTPWKIPIDNLLAIHSEQLDFVVRRLAEARDAQWPV